MKNQRGFSLIELIVAMAIMIVLSITALVNYSGTNKGARDARRASDMQKMAMSLEIARQVGQTYPVSLADLVPNYMQALLADPKGYTYYYNRPTAYTFTLDAYMEDLGSTNGSYINKCNAPQSSPCNYRVTNP